MTRAMSPDRRDQLIVWSLAFIAYAVIAPAGVLWMDSGELAAAGFSLGSSHPPGHPGHAMLAKLMSLIPIGEVAFRVALASAAAMAVAAVGVWTLIAQLVPEQSVGRVAATALFALSPAAILDGSRGEVYAMSGAAIVWAAVLAVRFWRAEQPQAKHALGAAGLCGIAAAFHPAIAVAAAVPLAAAVSIRARRRCLRLAPAALAVVVLAGAAYLYLPLRAGAAVAWDDNATAAGFWRTITGAAYQDNFALGGLLSRFGSLWGLVGEGIALGALLSGLLGLMFGAATRLRGAAVLLGCAVCVVLGASLQQTINPDFRGYVLPALAMCCVGVAIACEAAVKLLTLPDEPAWRHGAAAVVMVPIIGLGLIHGASDVELDDCDDVTQLVDHSVGVMPPGPGLFVSASDHALFPARYERYVAGHRPDIALTTPRLARRSWMLRQIERDVPALYVPTVDDSVAGNTAARLVISNLRDGRPVFGDAPWFGPLDPMMAQPVGRAYRYLLRPGSTPQSERVPAPPDYTGRVGARVAGWIGLRRGEYEAQRGRLGDAAYAAGLAERFVEDVDRLFVIPDDAARPPLYPYLPRPPPYFLWNPSDRELLGDELAWRAGLQAPANPRARPRRVHRMWRRLLEGTLRPGPDTVGVFGEAEEAATTLMLLGVGRLDLAEPHLRAFVDRRGDDADALAILGQLVAHRGDTEEARKLWQRALSADPSRTDVHNWLSELGQDVQP